MGELSEGAYITAIGTVVHYPLSGVSDNLRILSSVGQELILDGAHVPEITIVVIRGTSMRPARQTSPRRSRLQPAAGRLSM
jgi:hypothetical protein